MAVDETNSGAGVDLNGDDDALDTQVLHRYDVGSTRGTNLGIAVTHCQFIGDLAAIQVDEAKQGFTDLNGDGDALDRVFFYLDTNTGSLTNTGIAVTAEESAGEEVEAADLERAQPAVAFIKPGRPTRSAL